MIVKDFLKLLFLFFSLFFSFAFSFGGYQNIETISDFTSSNIYRPNTYFNLSFNGNYTGLNLYYRNGSSYSLVDNSDPNVKYLYYYYNNSDNKTYIYFYLVGDYTDNVYYYDNSGYYSIENHLDYISSSIYRPSTYFDLVFSGDYTGFDFYYFNGSSYSLVDNLNSSYNSGDNKTYIYFKVPGDYTNGIYLRNSLNSSSSSFHVLDSSVSNVGGFAVNFANSLFRILVDLFAALVPVIVIIFAIGFIIGVIKKR